MLTQFAVNLCRLWDYCYIHLLQAMSTETVPTSHCELTLAPDSHGFQRGELLLATLTPCRCLARGLGIQEGSTGIHNLGIIAAKIVS